MAASSISGNSSSLQSSQAQTSSQAQNNAQIQSDAQAQTRASDQQRQDTRVQNTIDTQIQQTNAQKTGVGNSVNLTA